MTNNNLHFKKNLRSVLLVLMQCAVGLINTYANSDNLSINHSFTAVTADGQILYYKITSTTDHTVMVTHPNANIYYGNALYYFNNPYLKTYNYSIQGYSNGHPQYNYWPGDKWAKPTGDLVIPEYVEYGGISYSVTAIDNYAFGTTYYDDYNSHGPYACEGLTSVIIPASVQTIGNQAFAYCTGLTTVTIPTSVTSIGYEVFRYCNSLVTVNFNATNCSSVGGSTWLGCTSFTTLNIGNTVTRIPDHGFQNARALASVTIPKKVITIGDCGFYGCTSLTNVTIANNSTLATIGQYAFRDCTNLTDVSFDGTSQLSTIDNYAFQNCSALATINLPNTLSTIGNYAFNGCSLLQSTSESQLLPNALDTIGNYAFQNASTLAYIRIPSTVTTIGKYAFKGCAELNMVDYKAANCTYSGTQAEPPFYGCSALDTVAVSGNVSQIPAYCFKDCASLTSIALCSSLSEIGTYAFYGCQSVDSLILPANLQNIGSYAFGNAFDLQLAHVESHNTTPPTIGSEAVFPTGQTIYVHMFSVDAYQTAENWSNYNIEGMYMVDVEITVISSPSEGGTVIGGGTVLEGETCTLTATANSDYVFVNWTENGEIVSTEATYSFVAESDRILVANFEMTNHWTAESYQNSMFMIGVVKIDGVEQASPTFELGAFCNGECRGSEFPVEEDGRWLYFMTIDGNIGDNISFRIYDHVNHQEMNLYCLNVIPFEVYGLIGMDDPYEVLFAGMRNVSADVNLEEAGTVTGTGEYLYGTDVTVTATANAGYAFNSWTLNGEIVSTESTYTFTVMESLNLTANFDIVRTQQLAQGWNWWSANLDITLDQLKTALVEALPGTAITIQSQTQNTSYNPNTHRWIGRLTTLDVTQMYLILANTACEITLAGIPVNPAEHSFTVIKGFNWFGFPLNENLLVNNALAGFPAVSGDIIQSQTNNCVFVRGAWRGAVSTFESGKGYMFISNEEDNRVLVFPTSSR